MISDIERASEYASPVIAYCVRGLERLGYWSIILVGVALTFLTEFYFYYFGLDRPVLHMLQLVLPMTVGVGLIWFGFRIENTEFSPRQIGILALSVLVGMVIFVLVGAYMHLLMSLSRIVLDEKVYFLLNAMAIGAVVNLVYGFQYVRLERAKERIRMRNDRLTQITSLVSHDLRNPLNVAQGHVKLIGQRRENGEFRPVLEALERIETLTDELLVIAKGGIRDVSTAEVSLEVIAREAWGLVDTRSADLRVAGGISFEADRNRLDHLLENLYRNAIEHGGDDVTVEVGQIPGGDGFYVADDGPGIDADVRNEIFDPGYSTADDGTGLGLNIVKEIVDEHDWTIDVVESETGGARFEIAGLDVVAVGTD